MLQDIYNLHLSVSGTQIENANSFLWFLRSIDHDKGIHAAYASWTPLLTWNDFDPSIDK